MSEGTRRSAEAMRAPPSWRSTSGSASPPTTGRSRDWEPRGWRPQQRASGMWATPQRRSAGAPAVWRPCGAHTARERVSPRRRPGVALRVCLCAGHSHLGVSMDICISHSSVRAPWRLLGPSDLGRSWPMSIRRRTRGRARRSGRGGSAGTARWRVRHSRRRDHGRGGARIPCEERPWHAQRVLLHKGPHPSDGPPLAGPARRRILVAEAHGRPPRQGIGCSTESRPRGSGWTQVEEFLQNPPEPPTTTSAGF